MLAEMLGLQSIQDKYLRENGTARYPSHQIRGSSALALRLDQVHHHHGEVAGDDRGLARGPSQDQQSHRERLSLRQRSTLLLRGTLALLPSERLVPAHSRDEKYDEKLVQLHFTTRFEVRFRSKLHLPDFISQTFEFFKFCTIKVNLKVDKFS